MSLWGKTDQLASVPKFINLSNYPVGTRLVFVDTVEATVPANKAKGLDSPGWWLYYEYTDASSVTRRKTEKLVAFSASVTPALALDTQNDDDIVKDFLIGFTTQPSNTTVTAPATATFTVLANPSAGTTYQWQVSSNGGTSWANVINSGQFSGATTATLTITGTSVPLSGRQYRVVASNTAGQPATSTPATLTVNA